MNPEDESEGAAEGAFAVPRDGRVTGCRNDDEGERNPGNANDETLKEIPNGQKAAAIRKNAANGRLVHPACQV